MSGNALVVSCLGFLSGIALATLYPLASGEILFLFLIAAAFVALALYSLRSGIWKVFLLAACFTAATALGAVRSLDAVEDPPLPLLESVGGFVRLEGLVLEEPAQKENSTAITLSVETISHGGGTYAVKSKVLVSSDRIYSLRYGDRLRVEGELALPESFETENSRTFDYPKYLEGRGVYVVMRYPQVEVIGSGEGNVIQRTLFSVKNAFVEALHRVLPEPESTLLTGLLLGSQGAFPQDLEEAFRIAGLSHIVVLSGYNITLVADAAMKIFAFLPLLTRLSFGGVAIVLFVIMVGASTAAVRAGLMALLVLLARATGRTYAAGRALLFAGTVMAALDPHILLGDIGFQLSFLATAGLIYGSPIAEKILHKLPNMYGLKALTVSTLSAQIFVLPLILYHSGLLSLVALPANLVVLPSVPIAMLLGSILGGVALLSTTLAFPFSFLASLVLKYEISAATIFAALPGSFILVPEFSPLLLVSIYLLGAIGLYIWHARATSEELQNETLPHSS